MITSVVTAESSVSIETEFGSELQRTSATIDRAPITPLSLSIGITAAPELNVIDGRAVKDVMRQLAALTRLMSRSLGILDSKYSSRLQSIEESQDAVSACIVAEVSFLCDVIHVRFRWNPL